MKRHVEKSSAEDDSVNFTTKNKGQEYRNTQKKCGEEAQKESIRRIDIRLSQSAKVYKARTESIQ